MELFGAMFGMSVLAMVVLGALAALLYPVFWIWMLVDSIVRDTSEYPGDDENAKLVWAILIAVVHPVSVIYFFLVFRKIRRGSVNTSGGCACVSGQTCV